MAHLNINSIRNKIEGLKFLVAKNVDILVISETKLDETFPTSQFLIDGFKKPSVVIEIQMVEGSWCMSEIKFQQMK